MTNTQPATRVRLGEGEIVSDHPRRTIRAVLEHPSIDVTWSRYLPGEIGPDLHVHHGHVDAFFILDGELQFRLGAAAEPVRAPAGTFVLVPPNVAHTFENTSTQPARWLNFHAPSSRFLDYLRGAHHGFDQHIPPADGGRSRSDAIVATADTGRQLENKNVTPAMLAQEPQLAVTAISIEPGFNSDPSPHNRGVRSYFVDYSAA